MKRGILSKIFLITLFVITFSGVFSTNYVNAQQAYVPSNLITNTATIASKTFEAFNTILPFDDIVYVALKPLIAIGRFIIGIVLGICGGIFDFVIQITVRDVEQTFNTVFNTTVTDIWKIFRDVANLIIIFSLLYLAIKTIIEGNGFADRKMLTSVLLAAIFVNFSLFATKTFFNVSNEVAIVIYNEIGGSGKVNTEGTKFLFDVVNSFGFVQKSESTGGNTILRIAGAIVNPGQTAVEIGKFIKDQYENGNKVDDLARDLLFFGMLTFMSLLASLIFLFASLVLIWRLLAFVILMMTSAIGLVGYFIPFLRPSFGIWSKQLIKHSVALPVFMFTFYIAYTFIRGSFAPLMQADFGQIFSGNFSLIIQAYVYYFFSLGLLLLTVFLPFQVSESVAGVAPTMTNKLKGYGRVGLNWAKSRPGWAGRKIGAGAATGAAYGISSTRRSFALKTLNDGKLKAAALAGDQKAMRKLRKADEISRNTTGDFRNIKIGNTTLGEKMGLGKGIKGYEERLKSEKKKLEEQKKQDMKILGFDKIEASPEEKADVRLEREKTKELLETAERSYKKAKESGDSARIKLAESALETASKAHVDAVDKFNKTMNKGEDEYIQKVLKTRMSKMSKLAKEATEGVIKDTEKNWRKGKAEKELEALRKSLKDDS